MRCEKLLPDWIIIFLNKSKSIFEKKTKKLYSEFMSHEPFHRVPAGMKYSTSLTEYYHFNCCMISLHLVSHLNDVVYSTKVIRNHQGWGQFHFFNSIPIPLFSIPIPILIPLLTISFNSNSNSNSGYFNSNSNSNSGDFRSRQSQFQK